MQQELIFYPSIALFALSAGVLIRTGLARFRASTSGAVDPRYYKLYQQGEEPEELRKLSRHLQNHFELPPLFHLVVLMLFVTQQVGPLSLTLAWAYVGLRLVHTSIHLGSNYVPYRFYSFLASFAVLVALWAVFAVNLMSR